MLTKNVIAQKYCYGQTIEEKFKISKLIFIKMTASNKKIVSFGNFLLVIGVLGVFFTSMGTTYWWIFSGIGAIGLVITLNSRRKKFKRD